MRWYRLVGIILPRRNQPNVTYAVTHIFFNSKKIDDIFHTLWWLLLPRIISPIKQVSELYVYFQWIHAYVRMNDHPRQIYRRVYEGISLARTRTIGGGWKFYAETLGWCVRIILHPYDLSVITNTPTHLARVRVSEFFREIETRHG